MGRRRLELQTRSTSIQPTPHFEPWIDNKLGVFVVGGVIQKETAVWAGALSCLTVFRVRDRDAMVTMAMTWRDVGFQMPLSKKSLLLPTS